MKKSLGEIAYEAYRVSSNGKSLVSGQNIPSFANLSEPIQTAWQAAGDAVAAEVGRADAGSQTADQQ